ncbi:hypothetical protein ALC53_12080, partial [Atta colombica]
LKAIRMIQKQGNWVPEMLEALKWDILLYRIIQILLFPINTYTTHIFDDAPKIEGAWIHPPYFQSLQNFLDGKTLADKRAENYLKKFFADKPQKFYRSIVTLHDYARTGFCRLYDGNDQKCSYELHDDRRGAQLASTPFPPRTNETRASPDMRGRMASECRGTKSGVKGNVTERNEHPLDVNVDDDNNDKDDRLLVSTKELSGLIFYHLIYLLWIDMMRSIIIQYKHKDLFHVELMMYSDVPPDQFNCYNNTSAIDSQLNTKKRRISYGIKHVLVAIDALPRLDLPVSNQNYCFRRN